jgi:hypothetical protein
MVRTILSAALILLSLPAQAETPTEWIELGARVHGAFGAFIPIGIRIGLDAKERIKADPRGLWHPASIPAPCAVAGEGLARGQSGIDFHATLLCGALGRNWHESDLLTTSAICPLSGQSGHAARVGSVSV